MIIFVMGLAVLSCIMYVAANAQAFITEWKVVTAYQLGEQMERLFVPNLAYIKDESDNSFAVFLSSQVSNIVPALIYTEESPPTEIEEDTLTYEMILQAQAHDENYIDVDGTLVGDSNTVVEDTVMDSEIVFDLEELRDVDYLLSNYYIIDSTTSVDESLFDIDTMMDIDMTIEGDGSEPQILIYHSHSQEDFVDSIPGDTSTTIVGVGEYLSEILTETYGINVIHHTGVYDLIDGVLDRSKAYELAEEEVSKILEENPTVSICIDLHRDGVSTHTHLVTEINGKDTAQIMFFNGLSRSVTSGDISYLYNPYIQENLAFSIQMQLTAEELYPGFTRKIYLKSYRYNMHLMPQYLLIEAGAQTNTVEEMMNAMEVLAEILYEVVQ